MRTFVGRNGKYVWRESWLIKLQLVLQLIGCDRRWHDFVLPITGGTVVKVKHSCSNFHLEWKMTQAARLSIYGNLEVIEESRMWALLTSIIIIICIFIIVIIKFSNFPQRKEKSATYCYGLLYWRSNIKSVLDLRNFILVHHLIWIRKSEGKKRNVSLLPTFGRRSVVRYFTFYKVPMVNS